MINKDPQNARPKELVATTKNILKEEGIRGFYKGVKASLVSYPMFYSLYFPLYENNKKFFHNKLTEKGINSSIAVYSLASATASIMADLVVTPLWVVRIRYQTRFLYNKSLHVESFNLFKEMKEIQQKEGFRALYKGLTISVVSSYQTMIQFNAYEQFKKTFSHLLDTTPDKLDFKMIALSSILSKGVCLTSNFINVCLSQ